MNDSQAIGKSSRPKIALIIDTPDWAFANIATQIKAYLSDEFEFLIIPQVYFDSVSETLLAAAECDVLHFFWRDSIMRLDFEEEKDYLRSFGFEPEHFNATFRQNKVFTTTVYDHLFLEPDAIEWRERLFSSLVSHYSVCSWRLQRIYSDIEGYPAPLCVTPDGVDLDMFKPQNLTRFQSLQSRAIRIGWVGNSKWNSDLNDPKGLETILKPAIELLTRRGWKLDLRLADRSVRMLSRSDMPDFYSEIDILVCSSVAEGTPNPVLEAMACGVPIVTTDVGLVRELFGPLQSEYILEARDPASMAAKIETLLKRPQVLAELSQENLGKIPNWSWESVLGAYRLLFKSACQIT